MTEHTAASSAQQSDPATENTLPVTSPHGEQAAASADQPEACDPQPEAPSPAPQRSGLSKVVLLGFLLLGGGLAFGLYTLWQHNQGLLDQQNRAIDELQTRLQQNEISGNSKLAEHGQRLDSALQELLARHSELEQGLAAQANMLRALSDTSRDDWLLAEAEYLLRLANQRIRLERSGEGVDALLSAADRILRDLDDPNLQSLRAALAKDLAAVRLMDEVDVEGIYLSLAALAELIDSLPLQVEHYRQPEAEEFEALPGREEGASWQTRLQNSWQRFVHSFSHAWRVIDIEQLPKPVLSPESQLYLQQNLRLMLERAQLALLREEQAIYLSSLQQADAWLEQYYSAEPRVDAFRQELAKLQMHTVARTFPDISQSLDLLSHYNRQLHKLDGVAKPPQDQSPQPDSPEAN